ncbi:hypothetical protein L2E82_14147 [Cichorium intybus]|uniref:Uncharacterized protein n=1 Tax=Cichorium intybus TaxID=13427 RepID=A0ACB9EYW0_CICIN|nr:hypothetical protein L2E82_14147 [Cichorium intybus]
MTVTKPFLFLDSTLDSTERDASAIRGEGTFRGPIRFQGNVLAAFERDVSAIRDEVMKAWCVTSQRIKGLVKGSSGYCFILYLIIDMATATFIVDRPL